MWCIVHSVLHTSVNAFVQTFKTEKACTVFVCTAVFLFIYCCIRMQSILFSKWMYIWWKPIISLMHTGPCIHVASFSVFTPWTHRHVFLKCGYLYREWVLSCCCSQGDNHPLVYPAAFFSWSYFGGFRSQSLLGRYVWFMQKVSILLGLSSQCLEFTHNTDTTPSRPPRSFGWRAIAVWLSWRSWYQMSLRHAVMFKLCWKWLLTSDSISTFLRVSVPRLFSCMHPCDSENIYAYAWAWRKQEPFGYMECLWKQASQLAEHVTVPKCKE